VRKRNYITEAFWGNVCPFLLLSRLVGVVGVRVCSSLLLGPKRLSLALLWTVAMVFVPVKSNYVDAASGSGEVLFVVKRYEIIGPNPLSQKSTDSILKSYIGEKISLEDLREAAFTLEVKIADAGYPFYRVIIPGQSLIDGVVELTVVAFPVTHIRISGNQFHSEENILRSIPTVKKGESPSIKPIRRELAITKLNPSKEAQVLFVVNDDGGLDANVSVKDQKTQNVMTWINDTGSDETGKNRVGAAYQNTNLFDRDHVFAASYTTSLQEAEDVKVYSASYDIPVNRYGVMVNAYAVHSDVDTGAVATFFDVAGKGDFIGASVSYALPNKGAYKHFVGVGIDDKKFDNEINFNGQPIGIDIRARPISLRHIGEIEKNGKLTSTYIGAYSNLTSGSLNDDISYALTRPGAKPEWSLIKFGVKSTRQIGAWSISGRFDGQHSSDTLVPGEQFGVGGSASVRGIEERQLSADKGYIASVEGTSPGLFSSELKIALFSDYGQLKNNTALPGEIASESVWSAGVGARWRWGNSIGLSADYGYVIDGTTPGTNSDISDGDGRIHFQILGRF
jgi:hemolysin activation/secretion protein